MLHFFDQLYQFKVICVEAIEQLPLEFIIVVQSNIQTDILKKGVGYTQ